MNATLHRPSSEQALAPVTRAATEPFEISRLRDLLKEHHYLGAGRPAGRVRPLAAPWERDLESGTDRLVAVFCWAGTAKRLKDRDEWIGWDTAACANCLKLIVKLRRFLIIHARCRSHLASQCIGRALRELSSQ